jgi:hypothetical protein
MFYPDSVSAYLDNRRTSHVIEDILVAKHALSEVLETRPLDHVMLPAYVRTLGLAYLRHHSAQTSTSQEIIEEHIPAKHGYYNSVGSGEISSVFLSRNIKDEIKFSTDEGTKVLSIETTTAHAKRRFVPLIVFCSRIAFKKEVDDSHLTSSVLRAHNLDTREHISMSLESPNGTITQRMARFLLALPHQPAANFGDVPSGGKADLQQ